MDSNPAISLAVANDAVAFVDGLKEDPAPLNVSTMSAGSDTDFASFAASLMDGAASVKSPAAVAALSTAPTAALTVPLTMSLTSSLTCFSMESVDFLGCFLDAGPALRPPWAFVEDPAGGVAASSSSSSSSFAASSSPKVE